MFSAHLNGALHEMHGRMFPVICQMFQVVPVVVAEQAGVFFESVYFAIDLFSGLVYHESQR